MAAKTEMIRARVEPELKAAAEGILADLGLSTSDAMRLLYKQIVLRKGLPFPVEVPNATTAKAMRDAKAGIGLTHYGSVEEMVKDLVG